jgi:hypothetical protein
MNNYHELCKNQFKTGRYGIVLCMLTKRKKHIFEPVLTCFSNNMLIHDEYKDEFNLLQNFYSEAKIVRNIVVIDVKDRESLQMTLMLEIMLSLDFYFF